MGQVGDCWRGCWEELLEGLGRGIAGTVRVGD